MSTEAFEKRGARGLWWDAATAPAWTMAWGSISAGSTCQCWWSIPFTQSSTSVSQWVASRS